MLRMGRTRSERASGRRGRERIATDAPRIARRSKHRNILSMRCYGSAPVLSGTSVIIMLIGPSGTDRKDRKRVVEGKSVSVLGDIGGRRLKKNKTHSTIEN